MVPDVSTGGYTRGLLAYLYGPGRRDEHTDPHIVAAWDPTGAPDPGRDPDATLTHLAQRLDVHANLRASELGRFPAQHVWHCPVRTAPGDRYLTDEEWAQVARRIVHATGIAPKDDDNACRWIAVRHADDHIHIVATTVRVDGRRPRNRGDGRRAQAECRRIEKDFGLRRLKSGDSTAAPTPTSAEQAKAQRQGNKLTDREWLRDQVAAAVAAARTEDEFFSLLTSLGIRVDKRIGPETGDILGYSVAVPATENSGPPVWFGGSKLAPDLSIPRIRERLTAQTPTEHPGPHTRPEHPWQGAEKALRTTHALLDAELTDTGANSGRGDGDPQAHLAAFGELLHNVARTAPHAHRAELRAAASAFGRATRNAKRAEHHTASTLRTIAKELAHAQTGPDGAMVGALLSTMVLVAVLAVRWHQQRGHEQQAEAAGRALARVRAAYGQVAEPHFTEATQRTPGPDTVQRLADTVRHTLPTHTARILTDPAWPALATTLARAETAGHHAHTVLTDAAAQRELDTADNPAHVLHWRITTTPSPRNTAANSRSTAGYRRPRPTPQTPARAPITPDHPNIKRRPR
ncbi:relaxase/mobilization nuclease domain-containing protein [Embleya sp. NPDC059237]|uniref:relaxase/mobilization nuclease domain-containing protein n=1 Tax=Embleya sp. NPDC059237 TaxID=3346784 RepID=UPI0036CC0F7A